MIKQFVLVLLAVSVLAGCGDDKEKVAREKIGEVKVAFDNRPIGTLNEAGTHSLTSADINACVTQLTDAKAKLDQIQTEYASTQAVQSMETQMFAGKLRGQLATCKQTKAQMGW